MLVSLIACSNPNTSGGGEPQGQTKIYHGRGAPSDSIGENYNHYYDETSRYVYEKKDGKWINIFTIGSDSLYQTPTPKLLRQTRAASSTTQDLKNALMNSFYSTNITCDQFCYSLSDGSLLSEFLCEINSNNIKLSNTQYEDDYVEYVKLDNDGKAYSYVDTQYELIEPGSNIFCIIPLPTFDNLSYTNFLLYDDVLGEQTSIVCSHLDEATYNSETGFYEISRIEVTHGPITTNYVTEPTSDTMAFSFSFKLSEDGEYVKEAYLQVLESINVPYYFSFKTKYEFTNYHSTTFTMPE